MAARSTKKAKRSVIISAKVPNQPGSPSSTEFAPSSKPLFQAFFSPGVIPILDYSRFHSAGGIKEFNFSLTIIGCFLACISRAASTSRFADIEV